MIKKIIRYLTIIMMGLLALIFTIQTISKKQTQWWNNALDRGFISDDITGLEWCNDQEFLRQYSGYTFIYKKSKYEDSKYNIYIYNMNIDTSWLIDIKRKLEQKNKEMAPYIDAVNKKIQEFKGTEKNGYTYGIEWIDQYDYDTLSNRIDWEIEMTQSYKLVDIISAYDETCEWLGWPEYEDTNFKVTQNTIKWVEFFLNQLINWNIDESTRYAMQWREYAEENPNTKYEEIYIRKPYKWWFLIIKWDAYGGDYPRIYLEYKKPIGSNIYTFYTNIGYTDDILSPQKIYELIDKGYIYEEKEIKSFDENCWAASKGYANTCIWKAKRFFEELYNTKKWLPWFAEKYDKLIKHIDYIFDQ